MDSVETAKEIISEVNKKVRRAYWTDEQIDNWFGKRCIREIIRNGTACFMNPCWDLNLVTGHELSLRNILYTLVIEEHQPTKDLNFDRFNLVVKNFDYNRLHFAVEFDEITINYKRENEVYISKGNYNGREEIPMAQILRVPGEIIDPQKSIHESLGYNSLEDLIKDRFRGFSLEKNLERLKMDNNLENYKAYKERNGEEFKIFTELQNPLSP